MDLFDLVPPPTGPEPKPAASKRADLLAGLVVVGLPALYLCVLIPTQPALRPDLAVLWGPVLLGLVGALVCVLGRLGLRRSVVATAGCLWWSLVAGVTMVVVDIIIFPF